MEGEPRTGVHLNRPNPNPTNPNPTSGHPLPGPNRCACHGRRFGPGHGRPADRTPTTERSSVGAITRMFSKLRHIDADPDDLVTEAHGLVQQADEAVGREHYETAGDLAALASAKVAVAAYLKEHHS